MKRILLFGILLTSMTLHAQKVTNIIFVGTNGVTHDFKKAEFFIVVKQFPDHFERLDYKKAGPLIKSRSYKDAEMKVLEGNYYEYAPSGTILTSGKYVDNKKTGDWNTYNNTMKVIYSARYENDSIVKISEPGKKDSLVKYPDEREASFPGGLKGWQKYLVRSLEKMGTPDHTANGGRVIINFTIGIDGSIIGAFVSKSVEFGLDNESLEIIKKSPKWIPAWQNGHAVNAFRRQPLTFNP